MSRINPQLKLVLDFLPLAVFFLAFKWLNVYYATGALLAVTVGILVYTYLLERRILLAPLITAIVVLIFGGLTLWLHNENFIKMKPTLINFIFAGVLLGGCVFKKGLMEPLLGTALQLNERGWFILSRRWGFYFLFLGCLNEYVRRSYSTAIWVDFKVFGLMGLTMLFALAQTGIMLKYKKEDENPDQRRP
jgi:intracellular septation protein